MSGLTTTYSSTGVINQKGLSITLTSTNLVAYTCPDNTVAKISGGMVVRNKGTANAIAIAVGRTSGTGVATYFPVGAFAGIDQQSSIATSAILQEGETITCVGQNGSHTGYGDVDLTIQELQTFPGAGSSSVFTKDVKKKETKKKETKNAGNK